MRHLRGVLGLLGALLLATGCEAGGDAAPGFTLRDSAGVMIAENAGVDPPTWTVEESPLLELAGDEEGHEPFFRLRSPTVFSDGRVAVIHANTRIRIYDEAGNPLGGIGQEGEGPGEFKFLTWLRALPGDTLAAYDHSLRRVSFFDSSGELLRTLRVELPMQPPPDRASGPRAMFMGSTYGMLADRTLVGSGRMWVPLEGRPGRRATVAPVLRIDTTGAPADTVGMFRMTEYWESTRNGQSRIRGMPLTRGTFIVLGRDRVFVGRGSRRIVDVHAPDGRLLRSIRELRPLQPVTGNDVEAWKASVREREGPDASDLVIPMPDSLPAHQDLKVDDRGRLWVADAPRPSDEGLDWRIFDPDGRLLGRLHTPDRFSLEDIRGDRLYGIWYDELDVPYLRVYRFSEP